MSITKKILDSLFSALLMVAGVALVAVGSVSFTAPPPPPLRSFPTAGARQVALIGGDMTPDVFPLARPVTPLPHDDTPFSATLTASAVLVVDDLTGTVLFEKNADDVRPLASITKLMSALVLVDLLPSWSATTTITAQDADGSSHHVEVGEEFTVEQLWQVALVGSSNSAIEALRRMSGLSAEEFVVAMNRQAVDLGLTRMTFVEPTGLDSRNIGSAREVAVLLREAVRREKIAETLRRGEYYVRPRGADTTRRRIWSTNWLLTGWIPHALATETVVGKTGFIPESLYNFALRAGDGQGHRVRVVVLGSSSSETRFTEARDVAQWALAQYAWPDEAGYAELAQ